MRLQVLIFPIVAIWFLIAFTGCSLGVDARVPVRTIEAEKNGCKDPFMDWCKRCKEGGFFCEE